MSLSNFIIASAAEPLILSLTYQSVKCKESVIQVTCLITHFLTNDGNKLIVYDI